MNETLLVEANEKGRLLSKALKIIEKLSKNDLADNDIDVEGYENESVDELKTLIVDARSLTSDRWWGSLK